MPWYQECPQKPRYVQASWQLDDANLPMSIFYFKLMFLFHLLVTLDYRYLSLGVPVFKIAEVAIHGARAPILTQILNEKETRHEVIGICDKPLEESEMATKA